MPARKLNLKVLLMVILGSLWLTNFVFYAVRVIITGRLNFYTVGGTLISLPLLWIGMFLCALKKKVPAVILISVYVVLALTCDVQGLVSYFSSRFALSPAEYFTADTVIRYVLGILSFSLMLLYVTAGWSRRDSLFWMLAYLGLCLCSHLVNVFQNHLYASPEGSLSQLINQMTLVDTLTSALSNFVTTAFFAVCFSPDKWYRRKENG